MSHLHDAEQRRRIDCFLMTAEKVTRTFCQRLRLKEAAPPEQLNLSMITEPVPYFLDHPPFPVRSTSEEPDELTEVRDALVPQRL